MGSAPNSGCENCISNKCMAELDACLADMGTGGAGGGAGVGGAGGAGGAGGGGPCGTCASAYGTPGTTACPESQALYGALQDCICGDATMPGQCGG
jgi:hypothetical protein